MKVPQMLEMFVNDIWQIQSHQEKKWLRSLVCAVIDTFVVGFHLSVV